MLIRLKARKDHRDTPLINAGEVLVATIKGWVRDPEPPAADERTAFYKGPVSHWLTAADERLKGK